MDARAQAVLDFWFGDLKDDYDPGGARRDLASTDEELAFLKEPGSSF